MKTFRTFKLGLLLSSFLAVPFIYCAPDTVTLDQAASLGAFVLDRTTGDLYVGTSTANGTGSITKITAHNSDGSTPTTTAVAPVANTASTSKIIRLMAPSYHPTTNVARLAFVEGTTNRTKVSIQSTDGTVFGTVANALKDQLGNDTAADGILALVAGNASVTLNAATWSYLFAATSDNGLWAGVDRGISQIAVTDQAALSLLTVATNGIADDGNAVIVSHIAAGGSILGQVLAITNDVTVEEITPALCWDDTLARLYVGNSVTGAANVGDRCISVLVGYINPATGTYGRLTFLPTVANTVAFNNVNTGIIYSGENVGTTTARNLAVMHTSTGHAYLIINGGNGTNATVGNLVYAIPLVKGNATDTVNGTFAKNDLTTANFSVQAVAAGDLCVNTLDEAKVGTRALPFTADTVTKMQVIGDTVYVSGEETNPDGDEGGIFYSTPEFNENGKIIRWSRWAKAAPNILGVSTADGEVRNFAVDPRNGKVWANDGVTATQISVSTWGDQTGATELAGAVNAQLATDGCTAMAVFDRTTVNWGAQVISRMAVFGGKEKVVFTVQTRTSNEDDPAGTYSIDETAITDYSAAINFLATTLPSGAGYVTALGGTLHTTTAKAFFFFAGTTEGLYAYANTAAGEGAELKSGVVELLTNLNAGFFANANTWQAITSITGHIKKIKSSDAGTFILARDIGTDSTIVDTLYMLATNDTTVAGLITSAVVVAQSGVSATSSDLTLATQILDFEIINGLTAGTGSQVILATNNGLYQSKTDNVLGIAAATSQATALWTPIGEKAGNADTRGQMYTGIFSKGKTNLTTSFQAICLKDNSSNTRTYAYRDLDQFSCSDDDNLATGNSVQLFPNNFLSNSTTTFLRTHRILDYWTDGARRFMLATPSDGAGTTGLYIWPYRVDAANWNITDPVAKISASALSGKTLYCINQLPDGHIAVGTNSGIVVL